MKMIKKIMFVIIAIVSFSSTVNAISVASADMNSNSYVIGTYLLTSDENEIFNTTGMDTIYNEMEGLFTPTIMMGATSINNGNYNDMIIYYKDFFGDWMEGATGKALTDPGTFEITHVNGICVDSSCSGEAITVKFLATAGLENVFQTKRIDVNYGEKISASEIPTLNNRPGYKFVCWTLKGSDTCFDLGTNITDTLITNGETELVLETKWNQINYNITYNNNFDDKTSVKTCTYGNLGNPALDCKFAEYSGLQLGFYNYHTFLGWSTTKDGEVLYKEKDDMGTILGSESDVTLYAIWETDEYFITYELGGGTFTDTVSPQVTFNSEDTSITLPVVGRTGYKFAGWTYNGGKFDDTTELPKNDLPLKANWTPITYSFTYGTDKVVCTYDEDCIIDINIKNSDLPIGQRFVRWYTMESGKKIYLGSIVRNFTTEDNRNYDLVAELEPIDFIITYNLNGGVVSDANQTTFKFEKPNYDNPVITLNDPTKEGYVFKGWRVVAGSATINGKVLTITDDSNVTLEAIFEEVTIPVKFLANVDGIFETKTVDVIYGQKIAAGDKPELNKRPGYKFVCWTLKGDDNCFDFNTSITDALLKYGNTEVVIETKWEQITYNITYNNNFSGKKALVTCTYGNVGNEALDCKFAKYDSFSGFGINKNYNFLGWSTTPAGEGLLYHEGADMGSILGDNDTFDLYAIWSADEYSISYIFNGGSFAGETTPLVRYSPTAMPITIPGLVREGYDFKGYKVNGKLVAYNNETEKNTILNGYNTNLVLEAIWSPIKYSFTYNDKVINCEYDKNCLIDVIVDSVPKGQKFTGWYVMNGTDEVSLGNIVKNFATTNTSFELKPRYEQIVYDINYDLNGGTIVTVNPSTFSYTSPAYDDVHYTLNAPTKTGYAFKEWKVISGSATVSGNELTISGTENVTLEAIYVENVIPVKFLANIEGIFETKTVNVTYNEKISASDIPILNRRPGYKFVCWTLKGEDECFDLSTKIDDTIPVNALNEVVLETKWEQISYEVTYHKNFDSNDDVTDFVTCTYGNDLNESLNCKFASYNSLNNFTANDNHTFLGWSTSAISSGLVYHENADMGAILGDNEKVDLYAIWDAHQYKISYDLNGGTFTGLVSPQVLFTYGDSGITLPEVSKEGYTFDKWMNNGTEFDANKLPNNNVNLEATWVANEYTFSYGANKVTCVYDQECKIDITDDNVPSDRKFVRWYVMIDSKKVYLSDTVKNFTTQKTGFTLVPEYEYRNFNISYDYDNGTVLTDNVSSYNKENGNVTITLNQPTRVGYTFVEWTIVIDGNDTSVASINGNELTITGAADFMVKAVYKENDIKITYYVNDALYKTDTCKYSECTIISDTPLKDGFTFDGWKSDSGLVYESSSKLASLDLEDGDVIMDAKWTNVYRYTISTDLVGGMVTGNIPSSYIEGEEIVLPLPTKIGYTFKGYLVNGTKVSQEVDGSTKLSGYKEDLEVFATWEANTYNVNFYSAKDTLVNSVTCTYDLACSFGKHNLKGLVGWSIKNINGPLYYSDNLSVINLSAIDNDNVNLYAVYDGVSTDHTISYYLDGGILTDGTIPDRVADGDSITLPTPTKAGYEFVGYIDAITGNSFDGGVVTSDLILIAKWKVKTYGISYQDETGNQLTIDSNVYPVSYADGTKMVIIPGGSFLPGDIDYWMVDGTKLDRYVSDGVTTDNFALNITDAKNIVLVGHTRVEVIPHDIALKYEIVDNSYLMTVEEETAFLDQLRADGGDVLSVGTSTMNYTIVKAGFPLAELKINGTNVTFDDDGTNYTFSVKRDDYAALDEITITFVIR